MTRGKGKATFPWSMILILAAALVLGQAAGSFAGERGAGRHGGGGEFAGVGEHLSDLGLSRTQKSDIALILKDHRKDVRECATNLMTARKNLFATVRAPEYNEGAVRQAAREVARWEEEMAVQRARLASEIQKVLTPEQTQKLAARKAKFGEKFERRMEKRFDRMDRWIDANAPRTAPAR